MKELVSNVLKSDRLPDWTFEKVFLPIWTPWTRNTLKDSSVMDSSLIEKIQD